MNKFELLQHIQGHEDAPANEVADSFGIDIYRACVFLHRNWVRGYLRRRKTGRRFQYSLSTRGAKHLDWLLTHQWR